MALTSFCGLVTVQVGAAIIGGIFLTIAGIILAANLFEFSYKNSYYDKENTNGNSTDKSELKEKKKDSLPTPIIIVILFALALIFVGLLTFFSSYNESRTLALVALIALMVILVFWIVMCVFSFLSHEGYLNFLCVNKKCPESFWIANLRYRNPDWKPDDEDSEERTTENPRGKAKLSNFLINIRDTYNQTSSPWNATFKNEDKSAIRVHNKDLSLNGLNNYYENKREFHNHSDSDPIPVISKMKLDNNYYLLKKNSTEEEGESRYIIGRPFCGAVLLFIVNLVFLLFSALTIWSWAKYLDWADYYYYDDDNPYYYY